MEAALFGTVVLCPYVALFACSVPDHGSTTISSWGPGSMPEPADSVYEACLCV